MPESFGVRLRQQRERQHIALATIAEQTKIKLSLLEELERDDVSHWPTGIFRRAFVRAYAHVIGLDQDAVVREFLEVHPEPPEVIEADPALSPAVESVESHGAPPMRLRYLVGSALDSLFGQKRGTASQAAAPPAIPPAAWAPAPLTRPLPLSPREVTYVTSPTEPADVVLSTESDDVVSPKELADVASAKEPANVASATEPADAALPKEPADVVPATEPAEVVMPQKPAGMALGQDSVDLVRLARLCSDLARLNDSTDPAPLLQEIAAVVDAIGFVVWASDAQTSELRPLAAHGYSDRVLAQLPRVSHDADNATAAAFRSAQATVVRSRGGANGALAIPIVAPSGCVGVLAIEVKPGCEDPPRVRALATVMAALLARLVEPHATAAGQHERAV
jgi:transcriptional regulator with XRE-family HTH domain